MKSVENVKIEGLKLFNNLYDYSNIWFDKEIINSIYCTVCEKHFNKRVYDFLKGSGCKKCGDNKRNSANRLDIKPIIEELTITNPIYDYSKIDIDKYKNKTDKVIIFCKKCENEFNVSLKQHIEKKVGCKCQKCITDKRTPIPELLERFYSIHSDKYEYYIDTETYKTNKSKIEITCDCGHIFNQTINNHLSGHGCSVCKESRGEKMIAQYLKTNNIDYIRQKTFDGCRDKRLLRFDFYLPLQNICIEYNGIQHYQPIKKFGGYEGFENTIRRDLIKSEYCNDNQIMLIIIPYMIKNIENLF